MGKPMYPSITVQLTGIDGNAFNIIATVAAAIRAKVGTTEANDYVRAAMDSPSYDALLIHAMDTVTVL
jgi:hypothetical protein